MTSQSDVARGRRVSPIIVTLAAMAALTAMSADAATPGKPRPDPPGVESALARSRPPIMAIVSIDSEQVTFYDANGWIMRAPVSTGTTGRETPAGVFAVIEKDKDHHSTMYDDAWMPNMQRITWQRPSPCMAGRCPGTRPRTVACVCLTVLRGGTMFGKTRIGMRVIISPMDAAPVEFSHPSLFAPNAGGHRRCSLARRDVRSPGHDGHREGERREEGRQARPATTAKSLAAALPRKLEKEKGRADAQLVSADKALVSR